MQIRTGDPAPEWKRSHPDIQVYLPKEGGVNDGDNHLMLSRSADVPWPKAAYDYHTSVGPSFNWIVYQKPIRDSKDRYIAGYSY